MQLTFVWWPSTRRYDTASRMEPQTKCDKGTKVITMVDREGIPLSRGLQRQPAEVRLIEPMLEHRVLAQLPK